MYNVYLKKNEEKRILSGESLVYANEVLRIDGKDKNGSLANVYDNNGDFIGKGFINHLSKVLVRILTRDINETDSDELFFNRINEANKIRLDLGYDNCYRVVYSEADNLPGLIVDKYDNVLVIEISSLGMDLKRDVIVNSLVKIFNPKGIYEKCEMNLRNKEGLKDSTGLLYGEVDDETIITENNIKISVDIKNGQKTGYFLDQKENRLALRKYTKDKEVLDCFSNTGGFSLNAATNCKHVTAVDISERATNNILLNAKLNNFNNIDVITDDVFRVLRNFKKDNKTFDCIVLDPPAFTKSTSEVKDALRGYKDINILAMKLLNKGGILVSSSCSHYITFTLFINMLKESAKEANKRVRLLEIKTQAMDHSSLLSSDDTLYLKYIVLKVE